MVTTVSLSRQMFTQICTKMTDLQSKYQNAFVIIGGDYNDAPNDEIDRIPAKIIPGGRFKCTNFVMDQLNLNDVWRFLNPNTREVTWSNPNRTQSSRIDLWMTTNECLQFIKEITHERAPLTDHKAILMHICGTKLKTLMLEDIGNLITNCY